MIKIHSIRLGSAIGCVWPKLNSVTLGRKSVARKKRLSRGKLVYCALWSLRILTKSIWAGLMQKCFYKKTVI